MLNEYALFVQNFHIEFPEKTAQVLSDKNSELYVEDTICSLFVAGSMIISQIVDVLLTLEHGLIFLLLHNILSIGDGTKVI